MRALLLVGAAVASGGEPHSLGSPLGWVKAITGVGHSLTMWHHPWHLKHWREFGSHKLAVPSLLALVTWLPSTLLTLLVPPLHTKWVNGRLGWPVQGHS